MALAAVKRERLQVPFWVGWLNQNKQNFLQFYITKGLGSGGTYGICIWHYLMCLRNHKSKYSWAIAPTYQQVVDTFIPTFTEVLTEEFGLKDGEDFEAITSQRPRIILKKRRQEIDFRSANRPERMVGPSISHSSMTEPGLCQELAFQKVTDRLRCADAVCLQQGFEGTPEGIGNAYEKRGNFPEGYHPDGKKLRIILRTEDNPFLPPGYVDSLRTNYEYDPQKLESYLYGIFVPFTRGTAYWEFIDSRNVKLDVKASPLLPVIFTFDFNASPMSWVALQRQPYVTRVGNRYHRFVALDEGSGKARGLMDACAEFISKFDPTIYGDTPIEIDGGHDGYFGSHLSPSCAFDQILQELRKYYRNVRVTASRKAPLVKDRLEQVNRVFAYERFVVAAWCRNLIKSLANSSLKPGTWELEKKKDDPTHFADAVGYPIFWRTAGDDLGDPDFKRNNALIARY